jgi:hypothetical protein
MLNEGFAFISPFSRLWRGLEFNEVLPSFTRAAAKREDELCSSTCPIPFMNSKNEIPEKQTSLTRATAGNEIILPFVLFF